MKKLLYAALICVLALMMAAPALAGARMPDNRGVVTDDADVLSAQTVRDIEAYAERVEDETDVGLYVATVHFLDGLDIRAYGEQLFSQWRLGDEDVLLLGAAGEDSFATVLGENVADELGKQNAENLMYTSSSFGDLFKRQQYDEAFASWFTALNQLLNKRYSCELELDGLFASTVDVGQAVADKASQLWQQTLSAIDTHTEHYQQSYEARRQQHNGIGAGGWIVLVILIMIIFGQSDPMRRARNAGRSHYRDYGCGCSPLGWLLTMLGVNAIIDRLRGRR